MKEKRLIFMYTVPEIAGWLCLIGTVALVDDTLSRRSGRLFYHVENTLLGLRKSLDITTSIKIYRVKVDRQDINPPPPAPYKGTSLPRLVSLGRLYHNNHD